ncbi:MAG: hypothetical protein WEB37_00765 [Bacteroidota bacterium]
MKFFIRCLQVVIVSCALSGIVFSQPNRDSVFTIPHQSYSSVGFNVSSVSGMGLSYRHHMNSPGLIQFTGGFLTSEGTTSSSLGFEAQYELSQRETFRYYIALGIGTYSGQTSTTTAMGFGMGLEVPIIGSGAIYESVTAGFDIFYPSLYMESGKTDVVTVGGSLYLFYSF